ncbi:MAG: hypothetical protein COX70_06440 [Flavobacteriales bacterium CG_4_10_14_0_2_um_filter_32_8]|nr:MAG: hypothetical protein COX70_06440 [Flavobacteriales bacterium CG_4_10_14_0_2_um_filter_32_8]
MNNKEMNIYKFRVTIEDNSDKVIFRDIEIKSTQTFEDFHQIILKAFNFDNSQMASFYVSDEDWNKAQEIALFDMQLTEEEGLKVLIMSETEINTQINCIGQHLVYTYDFLNMWNFFIELTEITIKEKGTNYPIITYTKGKAPKQGSKNDSFDDIEDELLFSENDEYEEDEYSSDDISEGFDEYENYEQ